VPEPRLPEVEVVTGKLKGYKSPGTDQIPAEKFSALEGKLYSEIHKLFKLIWNKKIIASLVEVINCHTYSQKGR
jgi:hypothetical protein